MKTCCRCKARKPASEFHNLASSSDGLAYTCKVCRRVEQAETRARYYTLPDHQKYQGIRHRGRGKRVAAKPRDFIGVKAGYFYLAIDVLSVSNPRLASELGEDLAPRLLLDMQAEAS